LLPETGSNINLRFFTTLIAGLILLGIIIISRTYRYDRKRRK
jgi:LPXTG-motif cell wall-anchored protein